MGKMMRPGNFLTLLSNFTRIRPNDTQYWRYTDERSHIMLSHLYFILDVYQKMYTSFIKQKHYSVSRTVHCCSISIHPLSEHSISVCFSLRPLSWKAQGALISQLSQAWAGTAYPVVALWHITHCLKFGTFKNRYKGVQKVYIYFAIVLNVLEMAIPA